MPIGPGNIRPFSMVFPPAWLMRMFGDYEGFTGFTEDELNEIGRLSETHLLKEAVRLVLLQRKETT